MRSTLSDRRETLEFLVEGMHCSSCGMLVDEAVEQIGGVLSSRTKVRKGRTVVETDASGVQAHVIAHAITDLGYRCTLNG